MSDSPIESTKELHESKERKPDNWSPTLFFVERWSGRRSDGWRRIYTGPDRGDAEKVFTRAETAMRQGAIRWSDQERVIKHVCAPNLRTRW